MNYEPNQEQVKSIIRTLVATFGGLIAGFFAARGWFKADQVLAVLNSPAFIGLATSVVAGIWGLYVHKQSNAVAVVGAIAAQPGSPVKAVLTEATPAGKEMARNTPGPVVEAGTTQATEMARR